MNSTLLTSKQQQLLDALRAGARVAYTGWQQVSVWYGPHDPRNYIARQNTVYALRDRGLVKLGRLGVRLVDDGTSSDADRGQA